MWPAAGQNTDQLVIWTHRQIQDVGAFTDTLEVPARWLRIDHLHAGLPLAMELPEGHAGRTWTG
jgi:hypothetical protein